MVIQRLLVMGFILRLFFFRLITAIHAFFMSSIHLSQTIEKKAWTYMPKKNNKTFNTTKHNTNQKFTIQTAHISHMIHNNRARTDNLMCVRFVFYFGSILSFLKSFFLLLLLIFDCHIFCGWWVQTSSSNCDYNLKIIKRNMKNDWYLPSWIRNEVQWIALWQRQSNVILLCYINKFKSLYAIVYFETISDSWGRWGSW